MPRLELSLLGAFRITLDGRALTAFESDKVRALLVYLAVEGDKPHRRELLAGLLWPEQPEARALANLSQALYNLRSVLGDRLGGKNLLQDQGSQPSIPFLFVMPQSVQLNPASDCWLDVAEFKRLLEHCESTPILRIPPAWNARPGSSRPPRCTAASSWLACR